MSPLRAKVLANEGWFAHCQWLFFESNRSNGSFARDLRLKAGLSLREVARRMEISAPFLSDLEWGHRTWSEKQCLKWEEAMQAYLK